MCGFWSATSTQSTVKLDRLLLSASSASDAARELVRNTTESSANLQDTLRDVSDAARSLASFFDALEREPDMLLKGRARRPR